MKRLAVIAALLVAPGLAMAQDSTAPTRADRFQLWNECKPIDLVVESLNNDAAKIGLTKEQIETAVRSRLRAARIYTPEINNTSPYLYVNAHVVSSAYTIGFYLKKVVTDLKSDKLGSASTWDRRTTGTHGRDAGYILQGVSRHTDIFIDEYLRVNAEAC